MAFKTLLTTAGWEYCWVDIYRLSSMHYMESSLPGEICAIFTPKEEVRKRYPEDQWYVETGVPPVKAWHKIQEEAYRRGISGIHTLVHASVCSLW